MINDDNDHDSGDDNVDNDDDKLLIIITTSSVSISIIWSTCGTRIYIYIYIEHSYHHVLRPVGGPASTDGDVGWSQPWYPNTKCTYQPLDLIIRI